MPVFSGASTVVNSSLFVNGDWLGIGTATPGAALDVAGTALIEDGLIVDHAATFNAPFFMTPIGTATATTSYDSWYFRFATSAYDSATSSAVRPLFQLQAEAHNNNTPNPYATFNLLAATAPTTPLAETGFSINANGTINFAPGQTFPGGTGTGTITGVTAGTALTGGGTTGSVTLNLDTTKVPLLAGGNTFIGNQTITGNLTASGTASAGTVNAVNGFDLGGVLFAFGSQASGNVYLGFAGNSSTTGELNTASGTSALLHNTTGNYNTASGASG